MSLQRTKRRARRSTAPPRSQRPHDSAAEFEKLLQHIPELERYTLRLFITGTSARSTEAVANIRSLCEEYLPGRYELEVVDIYQQPAMAADEQIIAAPTLIKSRPTPPRRLIGNLSNRDKVILGLDLRGIKGKSTKWSVL